MPDETDARSIITAAPSENWRPPGRPRTTWMKTIQQELRSNNLSLDEAIIVAQNRPLWRLMSAFELRTPTQEEEEECYNLSMNSVKQLSSSFLLLTMPLSSLHYINPHVHIASTCEDQKRYCSCYYQFKLQCPIGHVIGNAIGTITFITQYFMYIDHSHRPRL